MREDPVTFRNLLEAPHANTAMIGGDIVNLTTPQKGVGLEFGNDVQQSRNDMHQHSWRHDEKFTQRNVLAYK